MHTLFAFLGPMELAVIAVIGLLLFGRKLPSMGRSIGQTIVEFKKGVKGMEDDIDEGGSPSAGQSTGSSQGIQAPPKVTAPAPKFEEEPAQSKENEN